MSKIKYVIMACALLGLSACGFAEKIGATRAHNYATVLHSVDAKGIGIGSEAPFRDSRLSIGVEAGAFRTADDETSGYALTHFEIDLLEKKARNPRLGAFMGFASSPDAADRFRDRYPVIGNFVPIVGVQLTLPTFGPHELRLRMAPGLSSESAIFSIQSNFVF